MRQSLRNPTLIATCLLSLISGLAACSGGEAKKGAASQTPVSPNAGAAQAQPAAGASGAAAEPNSFAGGPDSQVPSGNAGTASFAGATAGSAAQPPGGTSGTVSAAGQAGVPPMAGHAGTDAVVAQAGTSGGGTAGAGVAGSPTAKTAAAAMGKGVNLGQMFESTQHPRTLAAASEKIDAYYAKGFRNLRIPVTWTESVGGDRIVNDPLVGDVNRSHPRLAVIRAVVDYALSKPDLYVIINAHHESGIKTENRQAVLERLWQDVADIFKDRSHRLLFEVLNEPHKSDANSSPMAPADLRAMTGKAYAKIRAIDSQRIILIGGNQWFGAGEMAQVWPNLNDVGAGKDAYLMATFHHYNPWTFCGDNQGTYADAWTEDNISSPMDTMLNWANSVGQGMPVHIGEWGVGWGSRYNQFQCNNIRMWYQHFDSAQASTKGIPTTVWDDGGWFKIYDHGAHSYANNLADCIGGTCAWDGTERLNTGCQ